MDIQEQEDQSLSPDPTEVPVPEGASEYGWVWVVGIVIVVALVLFALQRNVPSETATPKPEENAPSANTAVLQSQPGIYSVKTATSAEPNSFIGVDWQVSAPQAGTITHTAVHWGTISKADDTFDSETAPGNQYTNATTEYSGGSFAIPAAFETNIKTPENGTIYFRVHAMIDGKNYWTNELQVEVKGK